MNIRNAQGSSSAVGVTSILSPNLMQFLLLVFHGNFDFFNLAELGEMGSELVLVSFRSEPAAEDLLHSLTRLRFLRLDLLVVE